MSRKRAKADAGEMIDLMARLQQSLNETADRETALGRCTSKSAQGLRCGLDAGHDGTHYAIAPDTALWRKKQRASGRDVSRVMKRKWDGKPHQLRDLLRPSGERRALGEQRPSDGGTDA